MDWAVVSWPTLILLGLGVRMALHLHYGARGPAPSDPLAIFLSTASWVLIFLGLIPMIIGGAITFVGIIILLLVAATVVEAVIERREAQRRSNCKLLSLTVNSGQTLDSAVLFAGHETGGIAGRAAERLFAALAGGMPLAAAVERYPRALPAPTSAYLSAGRDTDTQVAALQELCRVEGSELAAVWRACIDRIAYLSSVLLVLAAVLTFLLVKIVPEFEKIFDEFGLELPRISQLAISVSMFFMQYVAAPLALIVPLLIMAAAAIGICQMCDVHPLRVFSDRLFRGRRVADVLRVLAIATEHREPVSAALARMAYVYPSPLLRRQLAKVAASVEAGHDWRAALFDRRFVNRAERALLETAERVGNLPWALRSIAQRKDKRAMYRIAAAVQVLYPCVILLIAAVIGFYVIALFTPLVSLIRGLSM